MHVASHDLFNMKLRTCLDTGQTYRVFLDSNAKNSITKNVEFCITHDKSNGTRE
jgi:hypothetical protein